MRNRLLFIVVILISIVLVSCIKEKQTNVMETTAILETVLERETVVETSGFTEETAAIQGITTLGIFRSIYFNDSTTQLIFTDKNGDDIPFNISDGTILPNELEENVVYEIFYPESENSTVVYSIKTTEQKMPEKETDYENTPDEDIIDSPESIKIEIE